MRRLGLLLAAALVLASALLGPPAHAGLGEVPPTSGVVADTVQRTAPERTCNLYGSANGFGMVCTDPSGGSGSRSLVSLLGGKPLPECWDEPAPAGYRGVPRDDPGRYWLRTCLRGLDRNTLVRTGKLSLDFTIDYLPPDAEVLLTPGQEQVIRYFFGSGQIPFPVLSTSPTEAPRVREPITFGLREARTPSITTQGVTMYAVVVQLRVDPGDGSPVITCRGPGELLTAEELTDPARADVDTVCRHSYERSSASAGTGRFERDRYPARVTASWEIRYSSPTGEKVLGTYEKTSVNQIRVTEVQTLVVS